MVDSHLFGSSRSHLHRDCCYCSLHGCIRHGPLSAAVAGCYNLARADFTCINTIKAAKVMAAGKPGVVALHRALVVAEGSTLGRHQGGGLADRAAWLEGRRGVLGRRCLGREVAGSRGHRSLEVAAAYDGRG